MKERERENERERERMKGYDTTVFIINNIMDSFWYIEERTL